MELLRQAVAGLAFMGAVMAAILFGGAGTFAFPQAWFYLSLFVGSSGLITLYLWRTDKALLARRVAAGPRHEVEPVQRIIQALASVAFVGILLIPALDRRWSWSSVPTFGVLVADALVLTGFAVVWMVFRENTFTAASIEVSAGQHVVSSGPYAYVRHPMYAGALLLLLATPPALGSWWGLVAFVPIALVIVWRLLDEERLLARRLAGYATYGDRVRYRLIPGLW